MSEEKKINFGDYRGRVKGTSRTETITPEVTLLSMTNNPIGTLFSLWHGSRHNDSIPAELAQTLYDNSELERQIKDDWDTMFTDYKDYVEKAKYICSCYPEHAGEDGKDYRNVIKQIAKMNILANVPSAESVNFVFQIDDCTSALRNQMVRSKSASYWTQTSRTADLRTIDVNMSESVVNAGEHAQDVFKNAVDTVRKAISELVELGVPVEDIRLTPEAMTHRMYWMISARSLMPIITKRSSWIAQISMWGTVISQVAKILNEIDPMFTEFLGKVDGVEVSDGKVTYYKYENEVEDRYSGRDPQPCDPLWMAYKGIKKHPKHTDMKFYQRLKEYYINLWSDEILDVLGWDRNDPSKKGYYDDIEE